MLGSRWDYCGLGSKKEKESHMYKHADSESYMHLLVNVMALLFYDWGEFLNGKVNAN